MTNSDKTQHKMWLLSMIEDSGRITLRELQRRWVDDGVTDGNPLHRSTFNRLRDEIFTEYGVIIDCDATYHYYIANPHAMSDQSIERWRLFAMRLHSALADSAELRSQILLEKVPGGVQFIATINTALRKKRRLLMTYQRFDSDKYERLVEPYALKLSQRRWYLLAARDGEFRTYALDRMLNLELTDESFSHVEGFRPDEYYAEYFGVLRDETVAMAHIVLRAYGKMASYLRTLPLHDSQRMVGEGEGYADYALDVRPTADFIGELLSHDEGVEILSPVELRDTMREKMERILQRYR